MTQLPVLLALHLEISSFRCTNIASTPEARARPVAVPRALTGPICLMHATRRAAPVRG